MGTGLTLIFADNNKQEENCLENDSYKIPLFVN